MVYTVSKQKVGKVSDYAVEVETMYIQKLYVSQSLLKNFKLSSLSVDRSQIQEITDNRVIIQDLVSGSQITATVAAWTLRMTDTISNRPVTKALG